METNAILDTQKQAVIATESIKGLSSFHEDDQQLLLKTYDKKNLIAFIAFNNGLNKNVTYKHVSKDIYVHRSFWIGVSTDGKFFQTTDHTSYTFLTENNYLPTDFVKNKET